MKPVCVPCERFMRPKKNGFYFLEGKPFGAEVNWDGRFGKDSQGWAPYKLWVGDLWECPDCGAQTVAGVSRFPVAEHFQPEFTEDVARTGAERLLVKDC